MTIRLLAFDLDGTLVLPDKTIDPRTKAAIAAAIDQGLHIALASGRDYNGCQFVLDQLDLESKGDHYLALINGQMVYDIRRQEYTVDKVLDAQDGLRIEDVCRDFDVEGIFCCGNDFYSFLSDASRIRKQEEIRRLGEREDYGLKTASQKRTFIDLNTDPYLFTQPINKVCLVHRPEWIAQHFDALKEALRDYELLMVAPHWLEIMPKGLGKHTALARIADKIGAGMNEVMAFGDAENDRSMLMEAGIGVAMGNAMESVKAAANIVTDSYLNQGVAKAIEALLVGQEEALRAGTCVLTRQDRQGMN